MKPTRTRVLVLILVVAAAVTWALLTAVYTGLPPLTWTGVPALLIAAGVATVLISALGGLLDTGSRAISERAAERIGGAMRAAVFALPAKQRAAVLMHKYEGMDYSQIARVLGCSEAALKSLLFRAYETLRAKLAHMA